MIFAFMDILINICLTVVKPKNAESSPLFREEFTPGDFLQILLAGTFGLAVLAFFLFQLIFAVYKSSLLSKIG